MKVFLDLGKRDASLSPNLCHQNDKLVCPANLLGSIPFHFCALLLTADFPTSKICYITDCLQLVSLFPSVSFLLSVYCRDTKCVSCSFFCRLHTNFPKTVVDTEKKCAYSAFCSPPFSPAAHPCRGGTFPMQDKVLRITPAHFPGT